MNKTRTARINIVIQVSDEDSQPLDDTGLTAEAYEAIVAALAPVCEGIVSVEPER